MQLLPKRFNIHNLLRRREMRKVKAANVSKPTAAEVEKSFLERHGFPPIARYPDKSSLQDAAQFYKNFVSGLSPENAIISRTTPVTAFGSCFAGNISRHLHKSGYNINAHKWHHKDTNLIRTDDIMVHTPSLLTQVRWALEGAPLPKVIVGGKEEETDSYGDIQSVQTIIKKTKVFIITFGLSEAWYDKEQETYLWKFVPRKKLDANRFENRRISFEENLENMRNIYRIIKNNDPDTVIVFTLSPIPLIGTYRDMACTVANAASKASLRCALDQFFSEHRGDEKLFYFPSYELVTQGFADPYEDDARHLRPEVIEKIMNTFETYYCKN